MDSLPLTTSAALKLVEVYQLAHDINQMQENSPIIHQQNDFFCGHLLEQKVATIFQASSTETFHEGLRYLLVFIEERLAFDPSQYLEETDHLKAKLMALKNIIIQIQDQSNKQNV